MKIRAAIFDCDGVLAHSELLSAGVISEMLQELGIGMSPEAVVRRFLGRTMRDELSWIGEQSGRHVGAAWLAEFQRRRNEVLERSLGPVPGSVEAVREIHALFGGRIACASGGDRHKIELQLRKLGLLEFFGDRICSGYEFARSKPSPDVYLAAIELLGVQAQECLSIEDSATGVAAAVAAGTRAFGYCPEPAAGSNVQALLEAGALGVIGQMRDLPALAASLA